MMNKQVFATTLREPSELVASGLAKAVDLADLEQVASRYAIAITPDIAALIDPSDPDDPIARQFIPTRAELIAAPGENGYFFFSSRRRHTSFDCDWSSDVCSSDLIPYPAGGREPRRARLRAGGAE